jgi:type IV secretion system protein VirB6
VTCPAIPVDESATITQVLTAIDCQVTSGVGSAYARLFASGGAFSAALTGCLAIFVGLLALGLLTGRTQLTLPSLAPKAAALVLVVTFATSWQAYQVVFHGLLSAGPDQIAAAMMGGSSGATQAFTSRLDALFAHVVEATQAIGTLEAETAPNVRTATDLLWFSALTLLFSTVGLLVAARIILALLLALGPVFLVLALFDNTRGLFEAWLRTTVSFALAPMLIVLGGSAVVSALGPMIEAVVENPAASVETLRPIMALALGAGVYALLLAVAAWTAISLTRGWRLRSGARAEATSVVGAASSPAPQAGAALHARDRTSDLVATLIRERAPQPTAHTPPPTPDLRPTRRTNARRIGLGQSYRKHVA